MGKIIDGKDVEYRSAHPTTSDLRSDPTDEGIFEGYAVTWGSIDDYDSTFKRGAFKKTLSERGNRIKILWNHNVDEPIGKAVILREDDKGLFVRGQLTKGVTRADDVFKNLKAQVIDTLSFGFITLQDKVVDNIRQINEVKLYEVSPVTFEANETAKIMDVRTKPTEETENKKELKEDIETKAVDLQETIDTNEVYNRGYTLMDGLYTTLWDIWWGGNDVVGLADVAISDFHAAYLTWVNDYESHFTESRTALAKNELSKVFWAEVTDSILDMAARTSFTVDELTSISKGDLLPLESRSKLVELPAAVRSAHQKERNEVVETLCNELRASGISGAEKKRFSALLQTPSENENPVDDTGTVIDVLRKLRNK